MTETLYVSVAPGRATVRIGSNVDAQEITLSGGSAEGQASDIAAIAVKSGCGAVSITGAAPDSFVRGLRAAGLEVNVSTVSVSWPSPADAATASTDGEE